MNIQLTMARLIAAYCIAFILLAQTVRAQDVSSPDSGLLQILDQGCKLLTDNKPQEALLCFQEGMKANPKNADLLVGAGKAALTMGDTASSPPAA